MHHFDVDLARHRVLIATIASVALAIVTTWTIVSVELRAGTVEVEWSSLAVFAAMLVWCERTPSTWIQVGSSGVVTPLWMCAFGILLVGSPTSALAVAIAGATVHGLACDDTISDTVQRMSVIATSVSVAGIVLSSLGAHGSMMRFDSLPWNWVIAIVAAGAAIPIVSACMAAAAIGIQRRVSFLAHVRRGLAVRLTAQGALLSLAPIWVIGLDFGIMFAPLLAITTLLVLRSTRQALERSHEAHHDPLTGLLNRRSFLDHLDAVLTESHSSSMPMALIMDLDGFKDVNDRLGHQIGDSLLASFAERLVERLPADAIAARLGGDEFAVLLTDGAGAEDIERRVRTLHESLLEPLTVEGFPVSIGVSLGAATAPADGRTPRDLIRAADVAMYKAKRTGSAIEHYATCIQGPQRGRLNLLSDLGEALVNHELHIHFQPQLRITDGAVDTVEALIRWQHPEHGSIPPNEFIGLAEQTDLIAPITEMVVRVATRGLINSGVTANLAINVSQRNLQDPEFAPFLLGVLAEIGFRPDRMELEVTERSIVDNAERCRYTIEQLRAAGVRIAIDDFGIGYASFQALRTLHVDRVKIDKDFVKGIIDHPRDRLIVASIIELAHDLGLDVVAEGVETTDLWDAIGDLGCDVAQGFGIAMPMAYPELRGWLSSWNELLVEQVNPPAPTHEMAADADTPLGR